MGWRGEGAPVALAALQSRGSGVCASVVSVAILPSLSVSLWPDPASAASPCTLGNACQERESLENAFSLWFRCPAPFTVIKCKSRGREILFRELCFISVLFCFGVFLVMNLYVHVFFPRTAQFLSASQYWHDAFIHLIFGATSVPWEREAGFPC